MRIGVTLGVDIPPAPVDLLSTVRLVEELGYSCFWLGDHVVIPRTVDAGAHDRQVGGSVRIADKSVVDVFEPMVTMGWLAAQVERIRLGFGVLVVPYRNPVLAAKMLASLDVLSRGRVVVGAGSGWMEGEFDALNASYEDRGAVTDEYLRVMLECWTAEHPVFHGSHYDLTDVAFRPKPVQRPHIPVYIGGNSDRALRRAVALGQGWLPLFHTPAELAPRLARLAEMCDAAGRDPGELTVIPSVRARLRRDDDPHGAWTTRHLHAIRAEIEAYQALGIAELTVVIVEPELDLDLLNVALGEISAVLGKVPATAAPAGEVCRRESKGER